MKKQQRLDSAKKWINDYNGKNFVKGYAKWYGVSNLTAVNELKILGIQISEEYIKQLKIAEENKIKSNREKREKKRTEALIEESEFFEFENVNEFEYNFEVSYYDEDNYSCECETLQKSNSNSKINDDEDLPF